MAKTILLLLVLAPLRMAAALPQFSDVPSLGAVAGCQKACGTKLMYDLFIRTMRNSGIDMSPSFEVEPQVLAIVGAHALADSFSDTEAAASDQLSYNSSLPRNQRDAYAGCMEDYVPADTTNDRIIDELLPKCRFAGLADEYTRVINGVESCRGRLLTPSLMKTPLYPMVLADRNKAVLASDLGKLIGI